MKRIHETNDYAINRQSYDKEKCLMMSLFNIYENS